MSVRVVARPVVHVTTACEACRARKSKCTGEQPCAFCLSRGVECRFAAVDARSVRRRLASPSDPVRANVALASYIRLFTTRCAPWLDERFRTLLASSAPPPPALTRPVKTSSAKNAPSSSTPP
jgi:hypothetical protein